jgi:hypothetical protein
VQPRTSPTCACRKSLSREMAKDRASVTSASAAITVIVTTFSPASRISLSAASTIRPRVCSFVAGAAISGVQNSCRHELHVTENFLPQTLSVRGIPADSVGPSVRRIE